MHPTWSLAPLLAALGIAFATSADARLSKDVAPTFQAIELDVDPDTARYSGRVVITLDVRSPVREIVLHADGQKLDRIALTQATTPSR